MGKTYEIRICIHTLIQSLKLTKYLKHHRHNLHGDDAERIRATIRDLQLSFFKNPDFRKIFTFKQDNIKNLHILPF